jgi:hypothetical protein
LRRRVDRIARPARVRIRRRNPWVFARRRLFGWNVRLLTEHSKIADGARRARRGPFWATAYGTGGGRPGQTRPATRVSPAGRVKPTRRQPEIDCGERVVAAHITLLASRRRRSPPPCGVAHPKCKSVESGRHRSDTTVSRARSTVCGRRCGHGRFSAPFSSSVTSRVAQRAGCISDRSGPRSRLDLDCSDHWAG